MNVSPPNVHEAGTQPRICVCSDDAALAAVRREFAAAGWSVESSASPGQHQLVGDDDQRVWTGSLDETDRIGEVVDLLLSGGSVVVLATHPAVAADVFDQCRRLAVAEWFDAEHRPVCDGLGDDHIALLLAIRTGEGIERAARSCNLSLRTAARRIADARRILGARSTADAATVVGARIEQLRAMM